MTGRKISAGEAVCPPLQMAERVIKPNNTSIETSNFGFIQPYYSGLFGQPMWFASFLIGFYTIFWTGLAKKTPDETKYHLKRYRYFCRDYLKREQ